MQDKIEFNNEIRFGHKDDDIDGLIMWIGDEANYKWKLIFPAFFGMMPAPPTICYLPEWIFERTESRRKSRQTFQVLADLEFLFHMHDKCGNTHNRVMRHGEVVLDLPCC